MITMDELLISRENRVLRQEEWLLEYKMPIVSFTLNIPGCVKQSMLYDKIHYTGFTEILSKLDWMNSRRYVLSTGSEGIISVDMNAAEIKKIAVKIESDHPLGRLFDIDVIDSNGEVIHRELLNFPDRKCLICKKSAKVCVVCKNHSIEDLLYEIERIAMSYFKGVIDLNSKLHLL